MHQNKNDDFVFKFKWIENHNADEPETLIVLASRSFKTGNDEFIDFIPQF